MDDKHKSDEKFKSNHMILLFITIDDVTNIMSLNITNFKCNNLSLYQTADYGVI